MLKSIRSQGRVKRATRLRWSRSLPAASTILESSICSAFTCRTRALNRRHGFVECAPFGDYRPDPNSIFLTRDL